jgi:hypothetical protein
VRAVLVARYLVDRLRGGRARADELLALRRRLLAIPVPAAAAPLARELRGLRARVGALLDGTGACAGCAVRRPPPHGRWAGGFCCGGHTEDLFTDDELASLRLAGTGPGRLRLPAGGERAGCLFRGPAGCALPAVDRPTVCTRYLCQDLERELHRRGALPGVLALCDALADGQARLRLLLDQAAAEVDQAPEG